MFLNTIYIHAIFKSVIKKIINYFINLLRVNGKMIIFTQKMTASIFVSCLFIMPQTASNEITSVINNITDSSTEIETLSIETTVISNNIKDILIQKQEIIEKNTRLAEELDEDLNFFKI